MTSFSSCSRKDCFRDSVQRKLPGPGGSGSRVLEPLASSISSCDGPLDGRQFSVHLFFLFGCPSLVLKPDQYWSGQGCCRRKTFASLKPVRKTWKLPGFAGKGFFFL